MADFKETLCIGLERKEQFMVYSYAWLKEDLVDNSTLDFDYEQECSYDELLKMLDIHNYDANRVKDALLRFGKVILEDEY